MIKIKCAKNHINKIYESFSQNFPFRIANEICTKSCQQILNT